MFALVAMGIVWFIGRRGIDVGAKLLGVLLVAETAILALLVVAVIVKGGADGTLSNADSFAPSAMFAPGMVGVLAFASPRSWASSPPRCTGRRPATPSGPSRGPPTPRSIFMGLFYCLVVWAIIQAFGNEGVIAGGGRRPGDAVLRRDRALRRRLGRATSCTS